MLYSLQQTERIYNDHMSVEQYSFQSNKRGKRQNQTLLKRNKSLPSLSFRWPELLSRVLEKNLNIVKADDLREKQTAATLQGRILLIRKVEERVHQETRLKINAITPLRNCGWIMWYPVNQTQLDQSECASWLKSAPKKTVQLRWIGFANSANKSKWINSLNISFIMNKFSFETFIVSFVTNIYLVARDLDVLCASPFWQAEI